MSENTKIEWTDHSWSPWRGCTNVSPGYANCYAEGLNHRWGHDNWGKGKPRRKCADWKKPMRWNRKAAEPVAVNHAVRDDLGTPARAWYSPKVFPSLCDWLDPEVPIEWLAEFLQLIYETPNLTWQLLTKRPELWRERMKQLVGGPSPGHFLGVSWLYGKAPANVWLGVSVEDQLRADGRIPELLKTPAALRFLSVEPLLGPMDLHYPAFNGVDSLISLEGINWIIIGGESGPKARPCNVDWIRSIKDQCQAADVPVFVKQLGAYSLSDDDKDPHFYAGRLMTNNTKGGDPSEWPEDLRVREMPN